MTGFTALFTNCCFPLLLPTLLFFSGSARYSTIEFFLDQLILNSNVAQSFNLGFSFYHAMLGMADKEGVTQ